MKTTKIISGQLDLKSKVDKDGLLPHISENTMSAKDKCEQLQMMSNISDGENSEKQKKYLMRRFNTINWNEIEKWYELNPNSKI